MGGYLSSQMVMCCNELAYICWELGHQAKAERYTRKAKEIASRINAWMWDNTTGLYHDVTPAGEKTSWISIATFWPLLAGVASEEQCTRLVENLKDPTLFWSRNPIPSLALNQPGYDKMGCNWRGGVWTPATNASGIHLVEPEFVGWTGLSPISMFIETIFGIEVNAPSETIR